MIVSRTPFRVSFSGGGTDFPEYYRGFSGHVISTTIDKYMYVTISERFDGKINIRYSQTEEVNKVDEIKHDIVREAMKLTKVTKGVEIAIISDIPSKGCGLGSSSVLSVGLLNALYRFKGYSISSEELAKEACYLELGLLGSPIGTQDQWAVATGGLNSFMFRPDGGVDIYDMRCSGDFNRIKWLEENSLLFYLGFTRSANGILKEHQQNVNSSKVSCLHRIKALSLEFEKWLVNNSGLSPDVVVNESWECKKQMSSGYSSDSIDDIISNTLRNGASAVKLVGAGGGGFMLVICEKQNQDKLRVALKDFHELRFNFSLKGSEIIYNDKIC